MKTGIYNISIDNTGSKFQQWFYNYLVRISKDGVEWIYVSENNCYGELKDFKTTDDNCTKEQLIKCVPISNDTPQEHVTMIKMNLDCGERFSHIYRPLYLPSFSEMFFNPYPVIPSEHYKDPKIDDLREYNSYIRQMDIVLAELFDVFKVVEPIDDNLKTYGNAIRNIIILSCTEVDALFKHILKANGVEKKDDKYTTQEYIKLKSVLRLDEYSLAFTNLDSINNISPYRNWNSPKTTQTLTWYDAYNKVKHDRIENFKLANLQNAIDSALAFATLLIASFGYHNEIWNDKLGRVITVIKEPLWSLGEFYLPTLGEREVNSVNHPDVK